MNTEPSLPRLKRYDLSRMPFSSTSMVVDERLSPIEGQIVSINIYSEGGNILILFKDGYDIMELFCSGEKTLGETVKAGRCQVWKAIKIKKEAAE